MSEVIKVFATVATADQADAGIAVAWFATHPADCVPMTALDYDVWPVSAVDCDWIESIFERSRELVTEHCPSPRECFLRAEHPGLLNVLTRADAAFRDGAASASAAYGIRPIRDYEASKWPATFDERVSTIRPLVNSGRAIKLDRRLRRTSRGTQRNSRLLSHLAKHRSGDPESASELLHAFVLGVLLGTTPERQSFFSAVGAMRDRERGAAISPSSGPFGSSYLRGKRPL